MGKKQNSREGSIGHFGDFPGSIARFNGLAAGWRSIVAYSDRKCGHTVLFRADDITGIHA
jgi:hypothetical protein